MKANIKILKICSLGQIFLRNKKIHFKNTFENKVQFDLLKIHNYHLVKVF